MDAEKAKSYVYYYYENYISLSLMKQTTSVFVLLSYIFAIYGILSDVALPYSIVLVILTIFYAAAMPVLEKNIKRYDSFPLRFLVNGACSLFMSVFFLVIMYLLLSMFAYSIAIKLLLTALLIVINLGYIGVTVLRVKNGRYLIKRFSYVGWISALGGGAAGIIGMHIARLVSRNFHDKTEAIIFVGAVFSLALLPSLGTANFLKYYWCKKYEITCDECGKTTSPRLYTVIKKEKKSLPKRIASTVLKVIGITFAALILVGIYIKNRI